MRTVLTVAGWSLALLGIVLNAWPFAAPAFFPNRYALGETTSVRVSYVCTAALAVAGVITIVMAPGSLRAVGGVLIAAGVGHQLMFYFGIVPAAEERARAVSRPVTALTPEETFYRA